MSSVVLDANWVVACNTSGLCNRIQAILSVLRLDPQHAAVFWPVTPHCGGAFSDLFVPDESAIVVLTEQQHLSTATLKYSGWRLWRNPYIDAPLKADRSLDRARAAVHSHVNAAPKCSQTQGTSSGTLTALAAMALDYSTILPPNGHDLDFAYHKTPTLVANTYAGLLRTKLKVQPLLQALADSFAARKGFGSNTVSVHMRTWTDPDGQDTSRHTVLFDYRHFVTLMRTFSREHKFFVTCDNPHYLSLLQADFPGRIIHYGDERKSLVWEFRSMRQRVLDDFVELLLLSKNPVLIGTDISTFTQVAWYLGGCKARVILDSEGRALMALQAATRAFADANNRNGMEFSDANSRHGSGYNCDAYEPVLRPLRTRATKVLVIAGKSRVFMDYFENAVVHTLPLGGEFQALDASSSSSIGAVTDALERYRNTHTSGTIDLIVDNQDMHPDGVAGYNTELLKPLECLALFFDRLRPGGTYILQGLFEEGLLQDLRDGRHTSSNPGVARLSTMVESCISIPIPSLTKGGTDKALWVLRRKRGPTTLQLQPLSSSSSSNSNKTVLVTYVTKSHESNLPRYMAWARDVFKVDDVLCYGPEDLDAEFASKYHHILGRVRGGGCWLWKPYVIAATMEACGCRVIYCDSSSAINMSLQQLTVWIDSFALQGCPVVVSTTGDNPEQVWTKGELFKALGCDDDYTYKTSPQLCATVMVYTNTPVAREFARLVLDKSCEGTNICDSESQSQQPVSGVFKDHRHDQSIMSLLHKKRFGMSTLDYPHARTLVRHHVFDFYRQGVGREVIDSRTGVINTFAGVPVSWSYINGAGSTRRQNQIVRDLLSCNINATRVQAKRGTDAHKYPEIKFHESSSSGQRGCLLSHYQHLLDNVGSTSHVGIFEDDAQPCEDLEKRFAEFSLYLQHNVESWDIAYLSAYFHDDPPFHKATGDHQTMSDNPRIHKVFGGFTTHAYIVNKDSVSKIAHMISSEFDAGHVAIDNTYIALQDRLQCFSYVPGMFTQHDGPSEILGHTQSMTSRFRKVCGPYIWTNLLQDFDAKAYKWKY